MGLIHTSQYRQVMETFTKTIIIMLDPNELDQLKIGNANLVTVDFATMFNESYIDPAEEMKQQPVALSIGTSVYKDNSYPYRLALMVTLAASLEHQKPKDFL
jgi:hypothetical protein